MPEYLAPGVYVEETSFRAKSIEGVSTSTTGFVGPTRKGPIGGTPELITSLGDFERIYGDAENLQFGSSSERNYLAHAVRAYFDNGGSRLYVSRVFRRATTNNHGRAISANVVDGAAAADQVHFEARFPGVAGNGTLTFRMAGTPANTSTLATAPSGSLLRVVQGGTASFFLKRADGSFTDSGDTAPPDPLPTGTEVGEDTSEYVTINVLAEDAGGAAQSLDEMGFDRSHPRWIGNVMSMTPTRRADSLENLYGIVVGDNIDAFELQTGLFGTGDTASVAMAGTVGNDGLEPNAAAYAGALGHLAAVEDVSIVAAPGSSDFGDAQSIQSAVISHAEARRAYRIAVLDAPPDQTPTSVRAIRGQIDTTYAAFYYPWVVVSNPLARPGDLSQPTEITLPPSGFVCGIYARNDVQRGVHKSPANEVVRGAIRFEMDVTFAQQETLNPMGVNCLRLLSGRGYRLWGARTATSDPEWKYVNVRRYFIYLEQSIDRGTQWAVFENNGPRLWANVRETIGSFLYNEWRSGALLGSTPDEAYFVRCDRSTMTQNDLDNGRLVCLIGVAALKPAEFVIFRIGQKTAEASS